MLLMSGSILWTRLDGPFPRKRVETDVHRHAFVDEWQVCPAKQTLLQAIIMAAVALSPRLSLLLPFVCLAFLDQRHSSSSNAFTCRTKFMVCSV